MPNAVSTIQLTPEAYRFLSGTFHSPRKGAIFLLESMARMMEKTIARLITEVFSIKELEYMCLVFWGQYEKFPDMTVTKLMSAWSYCKINGSHCQDLTPKTWEEGRDKIAKLSDFEALCLRLYCQERWVRDVKARIAYFNSGSEQERQEGDA